VEWSNPNDRADDPSDDDAGDGAEGGGHDRTAYPRAPLPKHERVWRHPSEMGQQAWVMSEPPLALGRGLLVATGAIGCAIGLAILWMLFPVGDSGPIAEPLVTRSVNTVAPRRPPSEASSASSSAATSSDLVTPSTAFGSVGSSSSVAVTLPAEDVPSNTVMLHAAEPVENAAIAVLIGDSPLMITTANAVGDDTKLSVVLDSGDTGMATVVEVTDSLAYLEPPPGQHGDDVVTVGFASAAEAQPGDVLHVLSPEPVSFTYDGDNDLGDVLDGGVVEGTPVVNDDGALVALCSHEGNNVMFIPVPAPPDTEPPATDGGDDSTPPTDDTTDTTTSTPPSSTEPGSAPGTGTTVPADDGEAWLGLRLASTSDGLAGVLIQSVWADSPAASAGLTVGQRIVAIDDQPVRTSNDVAAILQGHRPGDLIVVTVIPVPSANGPSSTTVPAPTTSATTTSTTVAPTSTAPSGSAPATSPTTAPGSTVPSSTTVQGTTSSTSSTSSPATTTTAPSGGSSGTSPSTSVPAATTTPSTLKISVVLGAREPTV